MGLNSKEGTPVPRILAIPCCLLLLVSGCGRAPVLLDIPSQRDAGSSDIGRHFDPRSTGNIRGQVTWENEPPIVRPFRAPVSPLSEQEARGPRRDWANPNVPVIDFKSKGVGGAVVFLRGIDPKRGRPWDHPPVRVEIKEYQFNVRQGQMDGHAAFVQRGAAVEFQSSQPGFQSIQARGDAFFALPLPEPGIAQKRELTRSGLVELMSGCGHFWMRGYLFVAEHPYFTRTNPDGSFTLSNVPPGDYQIVCWMSNWRPSGREIDADTWEISKLTYQPPIEKSQPIRVRSGNTLPTWFHLNEADFGR